ncbi:hypothetical protein [Endozoicomonas sp.]|uniref:hypothetical protein n=1 Tax=Endozoicomonas sp. TaxID=1892382 RepID=UPI00383A7F92
MSEDEAKKRGFDNIQRIRHVSLFNSKQNYSENQGIHWLKRTKGGILVDAKLNSETPVSPKQTPKASGNNGLSGNYGDLLK